MSLFRLENQEFEIDWEQSDNDFIDYSHSYGRNSRNDLNEFSHFDSGAESSHFDNGLEHDFIEENPRYDYGITNYPDISAKRSSFLSTAHLDQRFASFFSFEYFNAVQSQSFDLMYHSTQNVVISCIGSLFSTYRQREDSIAGASDIKCTKNNP